MPALVVLALTGFLSVGAARHDQFRGDLFVARAVQSIRVGPWEEVMEIVSFVGQGRLLAVIAAAFIAVFLWRRQTGAGIVLSVAVLSFGIGPVLKGLMDRPRPSADLITVWRSHDTLSFPSGHAFASLILFGMILYLAPYLGPRRWIVLLVQGTSALLILLIGISRVYMGAHWPSDVLGGFLYGGIVLASLIYFHRLYRARADAPGRFRSASPRGETPVP